MKTNQIMQVTLLDGTLKIGHKDHFGSLTDLFAIGNKWRIENDLKPIRHDKWLAMQGTKDFLAQVTLDIGEPATRSKRGKGGGIWSHLYILLDAATYLSPELKLEVYRKFIEGRVLEWRDLSGDNYIELNAQLVLTAEEILGKKAHVGHFVTLANTIKKRLEVDDWNLASPIQLRDRTRIEVALTTILRSGVVKDWSHLKTLVATC